MNKHKIPLYGILALELAYLLYLAWQRFIPGTHDGFYYFILQYFSLNNATQTGQWPFWIPYHTHGCSFHFWFNLGSGFLHNFLMLWAQQLSHANFIPLFLANIFIDEVILALGMWLWSGTFLKNTSARFFVTLTTIGSAIWMLQPWFNFHNYYTLPLIFYCWHSYLSSLQKRWLYAGLNLLCLNILGNPLYGIITTSLICTIYIFSYIINHRAIIFTQIRSKFNLSDLIKGLLGSLLSCWPLLTIPMMRDNQMLLYALERNRDGSVSLPQFLSYQFPLVPMQWLELFTGTSASVDFTLYMGILTAILIPLGIYRAFSQKKFYLPISLLIIFALASGSFIAEFAYHWWPGMKFTRHLTSIHVIERLWLIALAGLGLEVILDLINNKLKPNEKRITLVWSIILMLGASISLILPHSFHEHLIYKLATLNSVPIGNFFDHMERFWLSICLLLFISVTIFLFTSNLSFKFKNILLLVLLGAHVYDLGSYKITQGKTRMVSISKSELSLTAFKPNPYFYRRKFNLFDSNPQAFILQRLTVNPLLYSATNLLIFQDEVGQTLRTDFWLKPYDKLYRAQEQEQFDDTSLPPRGHHPNHHTLFFDLQNPCVPKITGLTEDKIQFFTQAEFLPEQKIANLISSRQWHGDNLLINIKNSASHNGQLQPTETVLNDINSSTRIPIDYQVKSYDANQITINVNTKENEGILLYYADTWHPLWAASVNGKDTSIYQANLAYKAIALNKGHNTVTFYIKPFLLGSLIVMLSINAALWLGLVLILLIYPQRPSTQTPN